MGADHCRGGGLVLVFSPMAHFGTFPHIRAQFPSRAWHIPAQAGARTTGMRRPDQDPPRSQRAQRKSLFHISLGALGVLGVFGGAFFRRRGTRGPPSLPARCASVMTNAQRAQADASKPSKNVEEKTAAGGFLLGRALRVCHHRCAARDLRRAREKRNVPVRADTAGSSAAPHPSTPTGAPRSRSRSCSARPRCRPAACDPAGSR